MRTNESIDSTYLPPDNHDDDGMLIESSALTLEDSTILKFNVKKAWQKQEDSPIVG